MFRFRGDQDLHEETEDCEHCDPFQLCTEGELKEFAEKIWNRRGQGIIVTENIINTRLYHGESFEECWNQKDEFLK